MRPVVGWSVIFIMYNYRMSHAVREHRADNAFQLKQGIFIDRQIEIASKEQ